MRPKKHILMVCNDPMKLQEIAFLLQVWGFHGARWEGPGNGFHLIGAWYDAALVVSSKSGDSDQLVREMIAANPDLPIVLRLTIREPMQTVADCLVYEGAGNAELRERLKTACPRKRGPKKRAL